MEPFILLQGVKHFYKERLALDIPELQIEKGSITGLAGPNGSGKSTLLRILALAEQCTSGTLLVEGTPVWAYAGKASRRITMLPQEPYLLRRTVYDNIAYGLRLRNKGGDLKAAVGEGLALVGLDPSFAARRWHELSGGEAQRVALAARLVLRPSCLLLDEPTASVDVKSGLLIQQAILHAREQWGTTLVIASHNRSWLHDICDHLIFLYNGRRLECCLDNFLPGPWSPAETGLWQASLSDGQALYAGKPSRPDSNGVLPPSSLRLMNGTLREGERLLRCTVIAIYIDKYLHAPSLQVNCGGQPLVVSSPLDEDELDACRPGREVNLCYRPENVIWLD
ncbi:MAG TPA: tungsten ABC transporter ATP-binding protein [Desulfobulbaceae bacterium]|nr:tungsten ABC transporter ATP-binding protein [Desulfobulbaceae bacterium]